MPRLRELSLRLRAFIRSKGRQRFWLTGRKDYVKFVILGQGRTGSNLLAAYLESHPSTIVRGELFNQAIYPEQWPLIERDPIAHLWREAFHPYWRGVKAVGFKMFYYHAREPQGLSEIWEYLKADRTIRIVHLVRNNILRTQLSLLIAKRTGAWLQHEAADGKDVVDRRIELDPDGCRAAFERTETWWAEAREFFQDHPMLEMSYEDLVEDPAGQLDRVQRFLGLEPRPLDAALKRQNPESLESLITNYEALKESFAETPWARFFNR